MRGTLCPDRHGTSWLSLRPPCFSRWLCTRRSHFSGHDIGGESRRRHFLSNTRFSLIMVPQNMSTLDSRRHPPQRLSRSSVFEWMFFIQWLPLRESEVRSWEWLSKCWRFHWKNLGTLTSCICTPKSRLVSGCWDGDVQYSRHASWSYALGREFCPVLCGDLWARAGEDAPCMFGPLLDKDKEHTVSFALDEVLGSSTSRHSSHLRPDFETWLAVPAVERPGMDFGDATTRTVRRGFCLPSCPCNLYYPNCLLLLRQLLSHYCCFNLLVLGRVRLFLPVFFAMSLSESPSISSFTSISIHT